MSISALRSARYLFRFVSRELSAKFDLLFWRGRYRGLVIGSVDMRDTLRDQESGYIELYPARIFDTQVETCELAHIRETLIRRFGGAGHVRLYGRLSATQPPVW